MVACRLKPPLLAMLAAPEASKVAASAGNAPFTSCAVGAACSTWAVSAEEYQVTVRWLSLAPTPRMMPLSAAGSAALAEDVKPLPRARDRPRRAAVAPVATRRRTDPGACGVVLDLIRFRSFYARVCM